ncbi:MAG: hypothetical protein KU37_07065 [Sulfuricurvum sp. PC08-66]|nr:MAG: hypothetical protein KU37_07065 [Sulfuricurvum sp. PC08-66]
MTADALLHKAKSQLALKHPYFGMLASRLAHEPHPTITSYASNGKRFLYNEAFIEARTNEELMFVLTNCVMHHILGHQQRRLGRIGGLWQLATDYAINAMLAKNGVKIPVGANHDAQFARMYAEEIYTHLLAQSIDTSTDAYENENDPDAPPSFTGGTIEEDLDPQTESEWLYASTLATEVAQRKSALPSGFDRLAQKVVRTKVDWRFELYNAINRHMRNNYAFMPPNKKHLYRGVALPSLASDTLSLAVAIDTSGSIDEHLLGAFIEEFKTIMLNFPAVSIELLIADAKVHAHHTFRGGEKMDFALKGGGGTDYRPTFDYIEANIPMNTMLLYFTDGDGWFPRYAPSYEVIWALSRNAKVPFGRALVIFE